MDGRVIGLMDAVGFIAEQLGGEAVLMAGRGGDHRAGTASVHYGLYAIIGARRPDVEARDATAGRNCAVVETADNAAAGPAEDELPVLKHQAAGELNLFNKADGNRAAIEL